MAPLNLLKARAAAWCYCGVEEFEKDFGINCTADELIFSLIPGSLPLSLRRKPVDPSAQNGGSAKSGYKFLAFATEYRSLEVVPGHEPSPYPLMSNGSVVREFLDVRSPGPLW
jgi:hypothetical protein